MIDTRTPDVVEMSKIRFAGNIIPHCWWKKLRVFPKKPKAKPGEPEPEIEPEIDHDEEPDMSTPGNPDWLGIMILADVCYWYRETIIKNEHTNDIEAYKKKFAGALLQRSYQSIGDQYGVSVEQARNAVKRLEKAGLIERVFETIEINHVRVPNMMFIRPFVGNIAELSGQGPIEQPAAQNPERPGVPVQIAHTPTSKSPRHIQESSTKNTEKKIDVAKAPSDSSSSSNHHLLIKAWIIAYKDHFGRDYRFEAGRDGKAVKELLTIKGETIESLVAVARRAWGNILDRRTHFSCGFSGTIHGFVLNWNKIRVELDPPAAGPVLDHANAWGQGTSASTGRDYRNPEYMKACREAKGDPLEFVREVEERCRLEEIEEEKERQAKAKAQARK